MRNDNIEIPAPKFERHEIVLLCWNSTVRQTRIVARWYDFDNQTWQYKIANEDKFYSADSLEHCSL